MSDETVSPAEKSALAKQSVANKTRLEKGLEDPFPASDPASATHTATATAPMPEILGLHPTKECIKNAHSCSAPRPVDRWRRVEGAQLRNVRAVTRPGVSKQSTLDGLRPRLPFPS